MPESDRRPVQSRGWNSIQQVSRWLADAGVSPNTISLSSMVFALIGAGLIYVAGVQEDVFAFRALCVGAGICIQLRLLANVFDGLVADYAGKSSLAGKLFNEWPDRVSDVSLLFAFGWLSIEPDARWLGALAACAAVVTAYVRELGRAIQAPQMFQGPLAKPQRMALLTGVLFLLAVWPELQQKRFWGNGQCGVIEVALVVLIVGGFLTAARRLLALHRHAKLNDGESLGQ